MNYSFSYWKYHLIASIRRIDDTLAVFKLRVGEHQPGNITLFSGQSHSMVISRVSFENDFPSIDFENLPNVKSSPFSSVTNKVTKSNDTLRISSYILNKSILRNEFFEEALEFLLKIKSYAPNDWWGLIQSLDLHDQIVDKLVEKVGKTYEEEKGRERHVFIAVTDNETNLFDVEQLQDSIGSLMKAMDFSLKAENEPIYGSFFQRLRFKLSNKKAVNELSEIYEKGKTALETKYNKLPEAEASSKLLNAAGSVIQSLEKFDNVVIDLGGILIIKTTIFSGESNLSIRQVDPIIDALLRNQPNLRNDPKGLLIEIARNENERKLEDSSIDPGMEFFKKEGLSNK